MALDGKIQLVDWTKFRRSAAHPVALGDLLKSELRPWLREAVHTLGRPAEYAEGMFREIERQDMEHISSGLDKIWGNLEMLMADRRNVTRGFQRGARQKFEELQEAVASIVRASHEMQSSILNDAFDEEAQSMANSPHRR